MTTSATAPAARHAPRSLVNTSKVAGRRELHFESLADILADAERLCSSRPLTVLGNWPLGTALEHLALGVEMSLEGARFKAPWHLRLLAPWFKTRFLTKPMPAGIRMSAKAAAVLLPVDECEMHEALRHLHSTIIRAQSTTRRHRSPLFGELTIDEWHQLHCRHAELHLSFFVPG